MPDFHNPTVRLMDEDLQRVIEWASAAAPRWSSTVPASELWMEGGGVPPFAVHGPADPGRLGRQTVWGGLRHQLDPRRPHGHQAGSPANVPPRTSARRSSISS